MAEIPVYNYNTTSTETKGQIRDKWWEVSDKEMHAHIFGVVQAIKQAQSYRNIQNLRYARLYSNMELLGLNGGMFARGSDIGSGVLTQSRVTYNVIKSCIDTAAAKIAKNKPRAYFLTDGGEWTMQRKAMRLTKYMEGLFDAIGTAEGDNRTLYGLGRRAFVDAGVFGTGGTKFYIDAAEKTVKAERCFIDEIVVDEIEGRYETPRQLHQEKLIDREIMLDMFPDYEYQIKSARNGVPATSMPSSADMIVVLESWHLPSRKDAEDGKKVISIENCTLNVVPWKRDYFPFTFQRWCPRLLGFYGSGLAEELIGIQLEINKLLRSIQISQHLMSVPQIWLEYASKAVAKHINNEFGGIKYYTGAPPIFMVPQAMSAEIYQHLENLYHKAYEITGISQLSAASKKPAGLDAAVALREMQDIETERFQLVGQRYEDYFMDSCRICLDFLDDIADDLGGNPAVRIKEGENSKAIKWKDVRMPKDQYTLRIFPTALLPSLPAGKLQKVQEMVQAGFWNKEEAMDLLDYPDIKAANQYSLALAQRRDIKRMIENMVENNIYEVPEPFMNLDMARSMAQSFYLYGRSEGMPENSLELLRRFMDDVQTLLTPPAPPPMPEMPQAVGPEGGLPPDMGGLPPDAGPGMPPMAVPAAPPVSDLLPVA